MFGRCYLRDSLQGMDTYPTEREVGKIIDSKVMDLSGICDPSLKWICPFWKADDGIHPKS